MSKGGRLTIELPLVRYDDKLDKSELQFLAGSGGGSDSSVGKTEIGVC